jgi:hypothetical protein
MIERRTRLLAGLFLLLAAASEAHPQTAQSGPPTGQVAVRKTGKSGDKGSSQPTGSTAGALPGLCFQPGVGWQRVLTMHPDGSATRDLNTSMVLEEHGSASGANSHAVYARLSHAKQARSVECPGILTDKKVTGAGAERFTLLNRSRVMRSAEAANPGPLTSLQVHPPYHPNGSAGLETVRSLPSAIPYSPTDTASEEGPVAHSGLIGDRAFHAYLSSVKLRRLIRNTLDFRMRNKLQQLQENPASPSHRAGTQAPSRERKGERVTRTSSQRSHAHDRSQGNSQTLGARP